MKKYIVVIVAMLLVSPAFGQINWGIKGGLSSTNLVIDQEITSTTAGDILLESAKEASWGFHAGAFLRVSFLGLYIQPELLFTSAENKIKITEGGADAIKSQKFNKLDIPVMLGFRLGPVRVNAGPAATIMLSSPKELFDRDNIENLYKSATFGYQAGLGVDIFNRLTLDVRYEGNLNKFGNELSIGSEVFELDQRSSAIVLSLGLIF